MTDKKDDAGKANPGSAASATPKPADAAKRPHATIDGKAVEISSTTLRSEAKPADTTPPDSKSAEAGKYDALRHTSGTAAKADDAKSGAGSAPKSEPKADAAKAAAVPRRGGGLVSAFTHLVAGVIGGATAWYGITAIGPELGIVPPGAVRGSSVKVLEERLAALERAPVAGQGASAALAKKVEAAEAEIARLQAAAKAAADAGAAQARLANDVKALAEAQSKSAEGEGRIAKLEERLKIMSDASGDPNAGKLPQLAAVTGRLVDLEATLTNQLSALRKTVSQELENRLALTNETSEAARSGTNRMDRELSQVKSETATIAQRIDAVKGESDRLAAKLSGIAQDTSALRTGVESLRADLEARFKAAAKPADVASAIAPVAGKVAALEQNVQSVVKSEEDRRNNAERIVLSLELNNLKRVIDRGQGYAAELAEVRKIAGGKVDLSTLERYQDTGLPTLADLTREFSSVANTILDSEAEPAEGSVLERMLANAKSVVRVRKVNHAATDKSVEAVIGRMETALKDGRIGDVATESRALPPKAAGAAQAFLLKLEARAAVDSAIAALEASLKASLAGKVTN